VRDYAVTSRVHGERPHQRRRAGRGPVTVGPVASTVLGSDVEVVPIEDRDAISLHERWDRVRDAWTQTTFYLFDPESWR
jgi:hypothetical protein